MDNNRFIKILNGSLAINYDDILSCTYANQTDQVVVTGSLVDGVGNVCSDLDVYVVTDDLPDATEVDLERHHRVLSADRDILREGSDKPVYLIHDVVPGTMMKIDVEFLTRKRLSNIFSILEKYYDYAAENLILFTKPLAFRDATVIHRIANGLVIQGELKDVMPSTVLLDKFRYLMYRSLASDFSVLLDLVGAISQNNWLLAANYARSNLVSQARAYLHIRGSTFTNEKWVLDYFRKMESRDLCRSFETLYLMEGCSKGEIRRYIEATLDFVDKLFEMSRVIFDGQRFYPSGMLGMNMLERDRVKNVEDCRYADFELEYRSKVYVSGTRPTKNLVCGMIDFVK